ncbi:ataxin-2 homolog isoform X2 [Actinia tenebrosa]|uniref:Ataxin-2 homolog isoform X2 n=1 Tax=Actinia tenebrosa TaxID=6105 RepID=A0A6P8HFV7_ACTTE|nr:ataxin-2 homolog isoform X2 [Actinia tenebrosa]
MNQTKRTKGRGSGGFNRGRNRGQNFTQSQNDDLKQSMVDIYQNPYLVHSIVSLLGCSVEVTVPNGTVYEGVLKTVSHTLDVTLEMAHIVQKRIGQQKIEEYTPVPSKDCTIETLVIGLKHIVCIAAKDVDLEEIKKENFTDTAISSRLNGQAGHERQLQKWEDPSGEHEEIAGVLEDSSMKNGLDPDEMFATNKEKYGVTSSYDHKMLSYTTPVEGSKELEDRAEILAREIEKENSHSDRSEVDSGKTEEELFSAVVRASGKSKVQGASSRDENKRDAVPAKDLPAVSPPKPQRVPKERDSRLSDNTPKPTAVVEQVKLPARDTNTISAEREPKTESSSVKPVPKTQVSAAESSNTNVDAKQPKGKTPELEELRDFSKKFKLAESEEANTEQQLKKETPATTSAQQSTPKEQAPSSTGEGEPPQQRDSPKVQEQQRSTDTPPKTTEKVKKFELNANAQEFKPRQQLPRTPPASQQQHVPVPSPTQHLYHPGGPGPHMRQQPQMKPHLPFNHTAQRYFPGRDPNDPHGGMSAAAATGNPIITQGYPHYITVPQSHQFHGGMLHMSNPQGPFMLHAGPQGAQPHYLVPHSGGNTPVQVSVAQTYQDNTPVPVYGGGAIPMTPSSPYQGSPQPSPTTQGQFLQCFPPQVMQQQQGNQPPIPHTIMPSPNHMVMVQQQGGPQTVTMAGIPVSGSPGSPMIQQYIPGPVHGYPASRKQPQLQSGHYR